MASPPVINNKAASSEADAICKVSEPTTTLPVPLGLILTLPLESVDEMVFPSVLILSTFKIVNVPRLVTLACAAVLNVPTMAVDVILVAPVTTPASTLIVPSKTIAEPPAGVIFTAPEFAVI